MMKKIKITKCSKTKWSPYGLRITRMKISEVSEFSILSYTQNRKLGNLGNTPLLSNSDSSYKSRFQNNKNMSWAKNWKVPIWFKRKKKNSRDFWVFDFALYTRLKTRKSRKFRLPQIMTLFEIQDLKTPTKTRTKRFQYDLEQNILYPRSKTWKSRKFLFYFKFWQ